MKALFWLPYFFAVILPSPSSCASDKPCKHFCAARWVSGLGCGRCWRRGRGTAGPRVRVGSALAAAAPRKPFSLAGDRGPRFHLPPGNGAWAVGLAGMSVFLLCRGYFFSLFTIFRRTVSASLADLREK